MRARAGLAAVLSMLGEVDAAISNYQEMLVLNPNDNQGIRYRLAVCLMRGGDIEALKKLLAEYDEDVARFGSILWRLLPSGKMMPTTRGPNSRQKEPGRRIVTFPPLSQVQQR
jgi:tetratricopeptide (TPR) repeat protein